MDREQIIKALECCHSHQYKNCPECPYNKDTKKACFMLLMEHSLALINQLAQANEQLSESYDQLEKTKDELLSERSRLTEENERLREHIKEGIDLAKQIPEMLSEVLRSTVRKTQERLHARFKSNANLVYSNYNIHRYIDQIAKEMLEGEE